MYTAHTLAWNYDMNIYIKYQKLNKLYFENSIPEYL